MIVRGDGQADAMREWLGSRRCNIGLAMLEPLHPLQIEGFRRMTPAQKLQMVADLHATGIQLRIAGLRMTHPDWSEERMEREARRSLLYAGT